MDTERDQLLTILNAQAQRARNAGDVHEIKFFRRNQTIWIVGANLGFRFDAEGRLVDAINTLAALTDSPEN